MVRDFGIGDKTSASFWAGIFISAFALAESITGMFWGGVSDRYGRKPILLLGCAGTLVSLMIVGFSTNFWMALAGRALGGLLNGYAFTYFTKYNLLKDTANECTAMLGSSKQWLANSSRGRNMNVRSIPRTCLNETQN